MSSKVLIVHIDDSSDKAIVGAYQFDRANGGRLVVPSGAAFPTVGVLPGEFFLKTDEQKIYRRNDGDTAWEQYGDGSLVSSQCIRVSDSTGGQVVPAAPGFVSISFDTIEFNTSTSDFTFSAPGTQITVVNAGKYLVNYGVGVDKTAGGFRENSAGGILVNGAAVIDTISYAYHRTVANGEGFLGASEILDIPAGATVEVGSQMVAGSATLITIGNTPRLSIARLL